MDDATIIGFSGRDAVSDILTEVLRKGARELPQSAVEAELDASLRQFSAIARRRAAPGRFAMATIPSAPCGPGSAR